MIGERERERSHDSLDPSCLKRVMSRDKSNLYMYMFYIYIYIYIYIYTYILYTQNVVYR